MTAVQWLLFTAGLLAMTSGEESGETPLVPNELLDPSKELQEVELEDPPALPPTINNQSPPTNPPAQIPGITLQYPWERPTTSRTVRSTRKSLITQFFTGFQNVPNPQSPAEMSKTIQKVSSGGISVDLPEGQSGVRQWPVSILDCTKPSSVSTIEKSKICDQTYFDPLSNDERDYVVLQQVTHETRDAVRCSLTVTSISVICGMFSHESLVQSPTLNEPRELPNDCDTILKSGRITLDGGRTIQTPVGSRTDYRFVSTGSQVINSNDITCSGSTTTLQNGETLSGVVTLNTATVKLQRTAIIFSDDGKIIDLGNNEELPASCRLGNTCTTKNHVEYVIAPSSGCNVKRIRKVKMKKGQGEFAQGKRTFVVSEVHQILLTMEEQHPVPSACGFSTVISTDQRHIYIKPITASNVNAINRLQETDDIDLDVELRTTSSFSSWYTGEQLKRALKHTASRLCTIGTSTTSSETDDYAVSPWHTSAIVKVRGQLILELMCQPAVATAYEGSRVTTKEGLCSTDYFPISYGGVTRLMHAASSVVITTTGQLHLRSCGKVYSPLIVTQDGVVLISDEKGTHEVQVHLDHETDFFHIDQPTQIHGGVSLLYSDAEVDRLGRAISHGFSKSSLLSSLTDFYCQEDSENCAAPGVGGSPFNPAHLMPAHPLEALGLGFLSEWWHVISGVGSVMSIIIVFYMSCQFLANILTIIKYVTINKMRTADATRLVLWPQTMFREAHTLNLEKKEILKQMRMSQIAKDDEVEDLIDQEVEKGMRRTPRNPSLSASVTTAELH